jgi:hypothetical protein
MTPQRPDIGRAAAGNGHNFAQQVPQDCAIPVRAVTEVLSFGR